MTDLVQRLEALRLQREQALRDLAKNEAAKDQLKATLLEIDEKIRNEFSVTPEEAPALLQKLEQDLEALITQAEQQLEKA